MVFGDDILNTENSDPLGRPYKKILLIHGPTGIGKTTISHIWQSIAMVEEMVARGVW